MPLYAYYRVKAGDAARAIAAARSMQRGLQGALPGLVCTLSQRADDEPALRTLMETYDCAGGVTAQQRGSIDAAARAQLAAWTVGDRHTEVFEPCV